MKLLDDAKAESFMKTLKIEAVYPIELRPSKTSPSIFLTSLTTSTTREGFIPRPPPTFAYGDPPLLYRCRRSYSRRSRLGTSAKTAQRLPHRC